MKDEDRKKNVDFYELSVIHIPEFYNNFDIPHGNIEIDLNENIYVYDTVKRYIHMVNKTGTLLFTIDCHKQFQHMLSHLAISRDGSIYNLFVQQQPFDLFTSKYSSQGILEKSFPIDYTKVVNNHRHVAAAGPEELTTIKCLPDNTLGFFILRCCHLGSSFTQEFFFQKYDLQGNKIFESKRHFFERDDVPSHHIESDIEGGIFLVFSHFPYCIKKFDPDGTYRSEFTKDSSASPTLQFGLPGVKGSVCFHTAVLDTAYDNGHQLLFCRLGFGYNIDIWSNDGRCESISLSENFTKIWLDNESNMYLLCASQTKSDLTIKKIRLDYASLNILKGS